MFWKNRFSVKEMEDMEIKLRKSVLYSEGLQADAPALSDRLKLKVEYVDNMSDDNEAELLPIENLNYYGLIRLRKELKKSRFAYIHEIIHYVFDVGSGKRVDKCFTRKIKGKTDSRAEQKTNYMTAAYIMPYEQIAVCLKEYDLSHPKTDEIRFIRELQKRYEQTETAVIRRIREVRKMSNAHITFN